MPSIKKAQQEAIDSGFLGSQGDNRNLFSPVQLTVVEKILVQYGAEFKIKLNEKINQYNLVASGGLAGDNIIPEVTTTQSASVLKVYLKNYFDYVNKGVRGVKSSRNAPGSPYQYKNLGMSAEGRQSLRNYIESGRAKIQSVRKYKKLGNETKGESLIDTQVDTLAYLIKAYGIKARPYFDEAFEETFKDLEGVIAEAAGADIVLTLSGINL